MVEVADGGFRARVAAAVAATGPLCAGIDPSAALLEQWGLPDSADSLRTFGLRCVEAFAGAVPVIKPQVAFFERHGSAGLAALESVLGAARQGGLLVIADAKRGDIGTTMDAYASAWLDPGSPLCADAVTVHPYLGIGALQPAFELAAATARGVVVVVRSSNPEGRSLQQAVIGPRPDDGDRTSVEDALLASIAALNHGPAGLTGTVGAVIGSTLAPSRFALGTLGGVILAPGFGAQGGTSETVAALFAGCPPGTVLPSSSRSLLDSGPDQQSLRKAALTARDELSRAFP
jgi:orotidine-5'-phosphate decarboxylase